MNLFLQWFLDQLSSVGTPALIMLGATIVLMAWIIFSAEFGPETDEVDR